MSNTLKSDAAYFFRTQLSARNPAPQGAPIKLFPKFLRGTRAQLFVHRQEQAGDIAQQQGREQAHAAQHAAEQEGDENGRKVPFRQGCQVRQQCGPQQRQQQPRRPPPKAVRRAPPAQQQRAVHQQTDTPEALSKDIGYQQQLSIDLKDASKKLVDKDLQKRIKALATHSVNVMNSKNNMATFADPIIILFLGGFFLAAAATKFGLDQNLARVLVRPFGTNPKMVMLGLMAVTALFSMFMSNTATAAMMIAILTPVLKLIPGSDKGRIAIALCIPLGANIGGMGTPIGTFAIRFAFPPPHDADWHQPANYWAACVPKRRANALGLCHEKTCLNT